MKKSETTVHNGEYQIVKAFARRGWRVNRWTSAGWERATDQVFGTRAAAVSWVESR